jgi:hypothetical protein
MKALSSLRAAIIGLPFAALSALTGNAMAGAPARDVSGQAAPVRHTFNKQTLA